MPSISYDFTVTVNPCTITKVDKSPATLENVEYTIGDTDLKFGSWYFTQSPACGWEPTIEIIKPDWLEYDDASKKFTLRQTFDSSLVGKHPVTVRHTLTWRANPVNEDQD